MTKALQASMTIFLAYLCVVLTLTLLAVWDLNKAPKESQIQDTPPKEECEETEERYFHPAETLVKDPEDPLDILSLGDMTVTIYHAVESQCDADPLITASGFNLEGEDIESLRVCALSRDLLKRWGGPIDYGEQIYIDLPEESLRGWWTVEDTMAKRWTNHIDLLVPETRKGGKWLQVEAWRMDV